MSVIFGVWAADGPRACAIHADLRLDNRSELVAELSLPPNASDVELASRAWARFGDQIGQHLLGDFALALVDPDDKNLVLVRDAFGVKPLYFARVGQEIAFSTDVATLVARAHVEIQPDETAIVDYIGGFPRDEERTAISAIRRVPPAHCLRFSPGRSSRYEWWRADSIAETRLPVHDQVEAFRAELTRAVESRLPESGRVGVLLSGGLDSSSVACIAARALARRGESLDAFSAVFAGEADERSFQRAVASSIGVEAIEVDVERADGRDLVGVLERFGEPTLVGGHWLVEPLLEQAKARDVRVILTGVDGDRVVSHGQGRLEELAALGDYATLRAEVQARGLRGLQAFRAIAAKAIAGRAPRVADVLLRSRRRWLALRKRELRAFPREVLARTHSFERWLDEERRPRSARELHVRALGRSDRASDVEVFPPLLAGAALEARHPFFDRRLVELCVSLPADQKLRAGESRFVLREAMRGILPEVVRTRPTKAYFDRPFDAWAARAIATNVNDFKVLKPYLDVARVPALPVDAVWRCMVVSAWLRGIETPT